MAEIKAGEPFGLDAESIEKIDWQLALGRVVHNLRNDFIYAPHLSYVYRRAGEKIIDDVCSSLKSGNYSPGVPITMEVPKSFRIRVIGPSKRLGPTYSRPGSILLPKDRLFYQALADEAAPIIEKKTNKKRSFSHRLGGPKSPSMFMPTRTCWTGLQKALAKHASVARINYVMKVDVANFFGSLNIHTLVNVLVDSGYPKPLAKRLETLLIEYTGERSSRGILQGIYPSDLLGNYYLAPLDRFLEESKVISARYVDDIYIFIRNAKEAERLLNQTIPFLRTYDLVLNEAKSLIMPKSSLKTEEPDLETMFNNAIEEIASQIDDEEFDVDYGFQTEWEEDEDDEDDEENLQLKATKALFDSIEDYPGQEENIERFCLPLFSKDASDYALNHVVDSFGKRPSMSQIYCSYLSKFINEDTVVEFLIARLRDSELFDWQKIWVLACLLQKNSPVEDAVSVAWAIAKAPEPHIALRAVAVVYVGRFGDHARRKALSSLYASVPPYVQAAIFYSSRTWPAPERATAKASWGGHGELQALMSSALSKS